MKNYLIILTTTVVLASCSTETQLYNWEKYDQSSYAYLKNKDDKSAEKLLANYDKMIKRQNQQRKIVPPGVYADYGFILIERGKASEGKDMLEKEMQLYPESKIFIDRIIKTMQQ